MHSKPSLCLIVVLLASLLCREAYCQRNVPNRNLRQMQQQVRRQLQEVAENQPELPSDPQLLNLHKEFIAKAEKLAVEYERKKQYAQAREVYESLVRLVPKYGAAEAGLQRVLSSQLMQDKVVFKVQADGQWQDSGATLREGMPVQFAVKGSWKLVFESGPEGIQIPEEMRPHDGRIKLGSLIAVVVNSPAEFKDAKPFLVKDGDDFIAKQSGRLYLRMFDVDPSDNEGSIFVMIQSTFHP